VDRRPPRKKALPGFVAKALNPYVEEAEKLAKEWRAEAKILFGAELGVSLDDVRALDKVCRFNREAMDDGMVLRAGFYLGEILRRNYQGSKYLWDARRDALSLRIGPVTVYPIEKIRKVVAEKDVGTLEEYLMVLAKKIADSRGHGKDQGTKPEAEAPV
jgi:hypothetical protein